MISIIPMKRFILLLLPFLFLSTYIFADDLFLLKLGYNKEKYISFYSQMGWEYSTYTTKNPPDFFIMRPEKEVLFHGEKVDYLWFNIDKSDNISSQTIFLDQEYSESEAYKKNLRFCYTR